VERARKPAGNIGPGLRVLIDRVGDLGMCELQQGGATATGEQPEIGTDAPRDRAWAEDALARIGHLRT